jgi:hypothetical protein
VSTDDAHLGPPKVKCTYDPEQTGYVLAFLLATEVLDNTGLEIGEKRRSDWAKLIEGSHREHMQHAKLEVLRECRDEVMGWIRDRSDAECVSAAICKMIERAKAGGGP